MFLGIGRRTCGGRVVVNPAPCPGGELSTCLRRAADDLAYLVERKAENVVENEGDAFPGCEPNHLVEEALEAATNGAVAAFHELLQIVTHPFDEQEGRNRFSEPAPDSFNKTFQTCCGT